MAAGLTAKVQFSMTGALKGATNDLGGEENWPLAYTEIINFLSGVGNGQVDKIFADKRTLAASATEDLDVAGGSLSDPLQAALTFAEVNVIAVHAMPTNTNDVQVTRPASNGLPFLMAAGDGHAVKPDGWVILIAPNVGWPVTAGTGDLITVTNSAGSTEVQYEIFILGRSS